MSGNSTVSADIVYQECLSEARHHRNSELTTANWNVAIMLAIMGGEIAFKAQFMKGDFNCISITTFSNLKILIAFFIFYQTASTLYSIYYSHSRYVYMREYTRNYFEQDVLVTALKYVETKEKPIFKVFKLYLFLMIGTGFLGVLAIIFLMV